MLLQISSAAKAGVEKSANAPANRQCFIYMPSPILASCVALTFPNVDKELRIALFRAIWPGIKKPTRALSVSANNVASLEDSLVHQHDRCFAGADHFHGGRADK